MSKHYKILISGVDEIQITKPPPEEDDDENITKIRTESMSSTGANQEVMAVGFEESKGSGDLKFVGSTENVRQFFADDTAGADESEKSFFESFTAAEGISLEDSTTSTQQQTTQPLKIDTSK